MPIVRRALGAFLLAISFVQPAFGSVHLMQIESIVGGVHGDADAQAVMLRMRQAGQSQLQFSRLVAWDAFGTNPVVLATPNSSVANSGTGVHILLCTAEFQGLTTPSTVPDFTMLPIPESYLAAGSLTFEASNGAEIYWRVSWGGGSYLGSNVGSLNNDVDGDFGPPYASPLPSSSTTALGYLGSASSLSTTNLADYAESAPEPSFFNNAGTEFVLDAEATPVGGLPRARTILAAPYPNPFNPRTNIRYELGVSGRVTVDLYSASGRHVITLQDEFVEAGPQLLSWAGLDQSARPVSSGVYLLRLRAPDGVHSTKLSLSK